MNRVHFLPLLLKTLYTLARTMKQDKKENVWIEKGEVKFLLLEDDKDALDRHPQVFC